MSQKNDDKYLNKFFISSPFLDNVHAYNGKLHERYTTSIYNIVYDIFAEDDWGNPLAGYVEPDKILQKAREIVFDFDYELNNETIENQFIGKINLRDSFEKAFIDKYLTDEIAYESFTLWKVKLKGKLEEIVPLLNMKFNTLCLIRLKDLLGGYDYEEHIKNVHNDTDKFNNKGNTTGENKTGSVGSVFPVNEVDAYANLESVNYASEGSSVKNNSKGTSENEGQNVNNGGYNTDRTVTRDDRRLIDNLEKLKLVYRDLISSTLKEFGYLFMGIM